MKIIAFDIETASADMMFEPAGQPGTGTEFFRIGGWKRVGVPGVTLTTDAWHLISVLDGADAITAHNGTAFDLMVLAHHHGADYEALCKKSWDTLHVERHLTPVAAKGMQRAGFYGLDETAARYGVAGKSSVDFEGKRAIVRRVKGDAAADRMKPGKDDSAEYGVLKLLAELYGGFHLIPTDDPDYRAYLTADVTAQEGTFLAQRTRAADFSPADNRYIRREHALAAATGRMRMAGFTLDVALATKRNNEGLARLAKSKQAMHEKHGMPLEGAKPHVTKAGKAAFREALLATGIDELALDANWPANKDGSLSTKKELLTEMVETLTEHGNEAAAELCRTILAMNGERSVYGTALAYQHNGRVHPQIDSAQASGRFSVTKPGMTVYGKRAGKAAERSIFRADEGDVLVAIDADQVDARCVAVMCQDPAYAELFQPGRDLHSEVAWRVFQNPECRAEMDRNGGRCECPLRDRAKVLGHGFNYGMGPGAMARQHGLDIAVTTAFCEGMTKAFPLLARWKEQVRAAAGALGFDQVCPPNEKSYRILRNLFGRTVRVERNRAYTQATAQLGQSMTRDVMAHAILKLGREGYRDRIRTIVHDELVLSIPAGEDAQDRAQAIADSMAFLMGKRGIITGEPTEDDGIVLRIGFGCSRVGDCWGSCYGAQYCAHELAA